MEATSVPPVSLDTLASTASGNYFLQRNQHANFRQWIFSHRVDSNAQKFNWDNGTHFHF